jgi:hypothetical protein
MTDELKELEVLGFNYSEYNKKFGSSRQVSSDLGIFQ